MTPNFEAATQAVQLAADQARVAYETFVKNQEKQMADAQVKVAAGFQELAAETTANLDAMVKAGDIVAKGAEAATKDAVEFAQAQVAKSMDAGKALLSAKSMEELFTLQGSFMKANADAFYAQGVKVSKFSAALTNDAVAPIAARVSVLSEKFRLPRAA